MGDAKEVRIPLALIAIGLAIFIALGFYRGGPVGAAGILGLEAAEVICCLTMVVIAYFIFDIFMVATFGNLKTIILRLVAISILVGAITRLTSGMSMGWLLQLAICFGFVARLFKLRLLNAILLSLLIYWAQYEGVRAGVAVFGELSRIG